MSLKISVITPSFNQGRYIEQTIRSVLGQGYVNLEYLVLDGGSEDGTLEVLDRYRPGIDCIVSERDSGLSEAVNKGLRRCTGDVIGWLNSDDTYLDGCLNSIASIFRDRADADIVYGDYLYTDAENRTLRHKRALGTVSRDVMLFENVVGQPASFFRRRVIEGIGLLNERLSYEMDWEFYIRALAAGFKFLHVRRWLATYRLHPMSKSSREGARGYDRDLSLIGGLARRLLRRNYGEGRYRFAQTMVLVLRLWLVLRDNPFDYVRCQREINGCGVQQLLGALRWRMKH